MSTAVAFESVWDRAVRELDSPGLIDRLQMLDRERCHIEAELADLLGEVDRREVFRVDQHTSVRGWARALCRWSDGEARNRARLARLFDVLPQVAEALAGGQLGVSQAFELGRVFANPRVRDQLADVIDIFLTHAEQLSFESFQQMVRQWESIADADGSHRDHEVSHRRRKASMFVFGTSVIIQACGGSVDGGQMIEIFERYQHAEYLTDWAAARATFGADATAAQLPRDSGQRAWDALMKIFVDAASSPPGGKRPEPVLNIVADQHTFNQALQDFARLLAGLDGVDGDGTIAEFLRNHHHETEPDAAQAATDADTDASAEPADTAHDNTETVDNTETAFEADDGADEIEVEIDDSDTSDGWPGRDVAAANAEHAHQNEHDDGVDNGDNGGDRDGDRRRDSWFEEFNRSGNGDAPSTVPGPAPPALPGRGIGGRSPDPRWWRCATVGGIPLPRSVLIEALFAGQVRRVIIDGAGVAVDVGRKRRFFTGPMRDALMLLTEHCVYPGCSTPSSRSVADHSHDYQHGGGTSTANGGPMCNHHNLRKNLGYETWRDPTGHWHTHRPDGTEIR